MAATIHSTLLSTLRAYLSLMKFPLCLVVSISAMFGFALNASPATSLFLLTGAGVFFVSCGAAALNNYQDRHRDRLFSRTKNRPLPSGQLPPSHALAVSSILILAGLALLYGVHLNAWLPGLSAAAVLLYNGVYTPLKHRPFLSLSSGAVCGMIPPLIGWTAAGGEVFSFKILVIMVIFGLWQFPHAWLILLDYKNEYQTCKHPNILKHLPPHRLEFLAFVWILNFSVMLLYIPIMYIGNIRFTGWTLTAAALGLMGITAVTLFLLSSRMKYRWVFRYLNITMLLIMVIIISDSLMVGF